MSFLELIIIVTVCLLLSILSYLKEFLNKKGAITGLLLGLVIGIQGGIIWIILLLIFLISSFLSTRYKFNYKKKRNLQEGNKGERGAVSVLANGLIPFLLALFHQPTDGNNILNLGIIDNKMAIFLFLTAIAAAAADTMASEMGILSDKTVLITTMEKTEAGTNGGISILGEFWAFIGSGYTFLVGYFVFWIFEGLRLSFWLLILGSLIGFLSCQIDSLLGASLERRGLIGKSSVNLISIFTSIVIVGVILWMTGYS